MTTPPDRDGNPPPHQRNPTPFGMGTGMNANPLGAFGGRDPDGGVSVLSVAATLALLIIAGTL